MISATRAPEIRKQEEGGAAFIPARHLLYIGEKSPSTGDTVEGRDTKKKGKGEHRKKTLGPRGATVAHTGVRGQGSRRKVSRSKDMLLAGGVRERWCHRQRSSLRNTVILGATFSC